jgi:hypothetical protein
MLGEPRRGDTGSGDDSFTFTSGAVERIGLRRDDDAGLDGIDACDGLRD